MRWSFADIGAQTVFIEHLEQNAPGQIEAFLRAVGPHVEGIRTWFARLRELHGVGAWPAAAEAFLNMVEMYGLVKPPDAAAIERQKRKDEEALRRSQRGDDLESSRTAIPGATLQRSCGCCPSTNPNSMARTSAVWRSLANACTVLVDVRRDLMLPPNRCTGSAITLSPTRSVVNGVQQWQRQGNCGCPQ
jgi:hypothetical protein